MELSDLEAGQPLPNIHLRLGRHWKVWDELYYSYEIEPDEDPNAPGTKVTYAFYPLVPDVHPHSQAYALPGELYESAEDVPEDAWPVLQDFAVLVRTKEFRTVGALPETGEWQDAEELTGLVVNEIRPLKTDERDLLTQAYPAINLESVLVVEEGRRPETATSCFVWMALGGGAILLGLFLILRSTTGRREGVGELPPLIKSAEVMT